MDLEWLNTLKRDWEIEETTTSRTITFPSMSKDIPNQFPDLKLSETCRRCKEQHENHKNAKCPYESVTKRKGGKK